MIRVLVVDDHDWVRMGISRMLADSADIEVVGEVDGGDMVNKLARDLTPDVILLDVTMLNIGVIATKRLVQLGIAARFCSAASSPVLLSCC